MDVFSKIKSTVSGALPGNPLTRDFDVNSLQVFEISLFTLFYLEFKMRRRKTHFACSLQVLYANF